MFESMSLTHGVNKSGFGNAVGVCALLCALTVILLRFPILRRAAPVKHYDL